ncbi:ABC1 kinase family protein [Microbacterium tenebrionis]
MTTSRPGAVEGREPEARPHPHRARYRRIMRFASAQLVQLWWFELFLPRIGLDRVAERTRPERMRRIARRFHALAVDLGGLMIKVGQFLSSRLDVLPPEVTDELAGLQDEVPAVPFADIRALAEAELGVPFERAFAWVDERALAAASLGQVHRARLADLDAADTGLRDVVVKVQRPGIDEIVAVDLSALRKVAGWLRRVRIVSDRVDAPALIEEFAQTSLEEVDYLHEAQNAERFGENFADDARVGTPAVVWERTTRRVLTLEDVTAIKINDIEGLRAAGIDPAAVADAFAAAMFEQVFTHSFFHADPHPGNIFVTPSAGGWRLTFVDFGMMGEVPQSLRSGLRAMVIAVAARDGRKLVDAAQEVGVLLPSADTKEFERALTALFARFGGMGFAELASVDQREFRDFAVEFGDTVRSLPFQLPEGMLLLFRAVSLTLGMCSGLNPAFNVWDAVEPFAAQLLRDEGGSTMRGMVDQAWDSVTTAARLPGRIDAVVTELEEGTLTFDTSRLERRLDALIRIGRRAVSAVIFAGFVVGGALLLVPAPPLAIVLLAVSAAPLAHAVFGGAGRR